MRVASTAARTDPGIADPSLNLDQRRSALQAKAKTLLTDGEDGNGYVEAVVVQDIPIH